MNPPRLDPSDGHVPDSIDLDLLNTGHGAQQRKMHGDLRREILTILDRMGTEKGVRWTEVARVLNEQSSLPVEANELASVIRVSYHIASSSS